MSRVRQRYLYDASDAEIQDGDSLLCSIDFGLDTWRKRVKLRLNRINCAERGSAHGKDATAAVVQRIGPGRTFLLETVRDRTEKYGRYLAEVWLSDGTNLNDWLVAEGFAVHWSGKGARPTPPAPV